ncbi:MAG TPA: hypothetical protein VNI58_07375 [Mariprofundaceae bacterium]|nr:hypothetical protein [Mariprofundaceae bacterium]
MIRRWLIFVTALLLSAQAFAQDVRYEVDVLPDTGKGETVATLHANISLAVEHALPLLWGRLLTAEEISNLPQDVRGIQFLQRVIPTSTGVKVIFDEGRVSKFLDDQKVLQTTTAAESPVGGGAGEPITHTGLDLDLTINRTATLPEQVLLESDLRSDPRVASLTPYWLNANMCKYRLRLKIADDSWVPLWFAQHGLQVTPLPEGWEVH